MARGSSMNKGRLLGSGGSLEQIAKMIKKYYYYKDLPILKENEPNIWDVYYPHSSPRAGQKLKSCRVRKFINRYRFEVL